MNILDSLDAFMVKENVSQYDEDDEFLSFSNHSHFVLGVIFHPKKD